MRQIILVLIETLRYKIGRFLFFIEEQIFENIKQSIYFTDLRKTIQKIHLFFIVFKIKVGIIFKKNYNFLFKALQ